MWCYCAVKDTQYPVFINIGSLRSGSVCSTLLQFGACRQSGHAVSFLSCNFDCNKNGGTSESTRRPSNVQGMLSKQKSGAKYGSISLTQVAGKASQD